MGLDPRFEPAPNTCHVWVPFKTTAEGAGRWTITAASAEAGFRGSVRADTDPAGLNDSQPTGYGLGIKHPDQMSDELLKCGERCLVREAKDCNASRPVGRESDDIQEAKISVSRVRPPRTRAPDPHSTRFARTGSRDSHPISISRGAAARQVYVAFAAHVGAVADRCEDVLALQMRV